VIGLISQATWTAIRRRLSQSLDEYAGRFLDLIMLHLEWSYDDKYKVRVRRLKPEEFAKHHPIDRLAGEIEAIENIEGRRIPVHHIELNWNKIVDAKDDQFVIELTLCLVHEILEIYQKKSGKRVIHLPEDNDRPSKIERVLWVRCLTKILGLPANIVDQYGWSSGSKSSQ